MFLFHPDQWPLKLEVLYKKLSEALSEHGVEDPKFEARVMIEQRTAYTYSDLISGSDDIISREALESILSDLEKRLSGVPIYRIYGVREFWGLDFEITPETLEPRQDTEVLVDVCLAKVPKNKPIRILDLGTGSGCILLSLLKELPYASGFGVDLSEGAVRCAARNAKRLGLSDRAAFICGSWADSLSGEFDVVVSNPPYIATRILPNLEKSVLDHDPILALDGGADGLKSYQETFSAMKRLVSYNANAFFEIGFDQEESVVRLAAKYGFLVSRVHADLAGRARVVEISCGDK